MKDDQGEGVPGRPTDALQALESARSIRPIGLLLRADAGSARRMSDWPMA
jgi:hypothetical protein